MNAQQPWSLPPEKPKQKRRRSYDQQSQAQKALAKEVSAKLFVNTILTLITTASLVRLVPYYLSQQAKLQEVKAEIQDTQTRVNQLNQEFSYYFDAQQSQSLIKRYTVKVDPSELRLFLIREDANLNDEAK
ncbi:MAG: hypothetical protein EA365_10315 [Gloeocapsa sp. DLM2.Bin57]|nr:MAG: hypothetical protein EA365_10315 [Gloeocapsa sp. DLM2.Bin57]